MTPDRILHLAHAAGRVLKEASGRPTVLLGRDTRLSSEMAESALRCGFTSAGVDVVMLGVLPACGIAYMTRTLRAELGVAIGSTSAGSNGLQFFGAKGAAPPDGWREEVDLALRAPHAWAQSSCLGRARELPEAGGRYVEFCKSTCGSRFTLKGLRVVVDAAHGSAHEIGPQLFYELGADVTSVACAPDGHNTGERSGPDHPATLVDAVRSHGADFGISIGGDGSRLLMADGAGRIYGVDELLYLLAVERLQRGVRVPGVVGNSMTNVGIEIALLARTVQVLRCDPASKAAEEMGARGWSLGASAQGELLVLDQQATPDALVGALQVLSALVRGGTTLSEMLDGVRMYPRAVVDVPFKRAGGSQESRALAAEVRKAKARLGAFGRVSIAASDSRPLLRVLVEAPDETLAHELAGRLARHANFMGGPAGARMLSAANGM